MSDTCALACYYALFVEDALALDKWFALQARTVPTNEREISWQPDNRMASGGSCPADPRISLMGQSYTLEIFSLACEYIRRYGRPVVLLIAAFISYIIVSGAFRQ